MTTLNFIDLAGNEPNLDKHTQVGKEGESNNKNLKILGQAIKIFIEEKKVSEEKRRIECRRTKLTSLLYLTLREMCLVCV